jgi:hypothetical protein
MTKPGYGPFRHRIVEGFNSIKSPAHLLQQMGGSALTDVGQKFGSQFGFAGNIGSSQRTEFEKSLAVFINLTEFQPD